MTTTSRPAPELDLGLDLAEGYVTELSYTLGYHEGLEPAKVLRALRADADADARGCELPTLRRACELGFGRGLNIAINSVAGDIEWWGNDLLPEHVAGVRQLTAGLTARLHVFAESFAQFCTREDLPSFDFIALHGVWSWVSIDNRRRILDFIGRRLAPRGVVYLSYNVLAGWRSVIPLREFLVREAARPEYANLPLGERIEAALVAAQAYVASDPEELLANPDFEKHLRRIRHQRKAYLAHEYFNRDWAPVDFIEVAESLTALGLVYAGQVPGDGVSHVDVSAASYAALHDQDLRSQRRFRRDLWWRPAVSVADDIERTVTREADPEVCRSHRSERVAAVADLNDRLLRIALSEPQLSVLASPLTGSGVEIGWHGLLCLSAWRGGARTASAIAAQVRQRLSELTHPYVRGGVLISDEAEIRSSLQREAQRFLADTMPRLRQLAIEP